ncbi:GntR family transcriptional regulator [Bosea sp. BK604]|uniref:GntR family transcriptional regulator n=1 Tax=Bosea sp. BK604 TaxID=2512180 RepID=UPI001042A62B|nr:GntR family transcriptional regulator [Bosea sp. BK604]TCR64187.1 GntR family transcriptional regulator [Bosea sp. BK604]
MPAVNAKKKSSPASEAGSPLGIPSGAIPNLTATEALPLYEKAKRHMSEAILMGEWPPGTVLPNETALAQMFGIAVGTVRRAMSDLVAEGLLSRRRKTGTVVTGRSPHHSMRIFFQYFRLHRADGTLVRSRAEVLSVGLLKASERESEQLQIAPGAEVVKIHRIRHVDDRPVMHDRLVLAAERVPGLPHEPAELPELLYIHLLERYGIRISAVREQLTADFADAEDARLLNLSLPAPMLTIEEIAYDQAGAPTILGWHRASTEHHRYINEVR